MSACSPFDWFFLSAFVFFGNLECDTGVLSSSSLEYSNDCCNRRVHNITPPRFGLNNNYRGGAIQYVVAKPKKSKVLMEKILCATPIHLVRPDERGHMLPLVRV